MSYWLIQVYRRTTPFILHSTLVLIFLCSYFVKKYHNSNTNFSVAWIWGIYLTNSVISVRTNSTRAHTRPHAHRHTRAHVRSGSSGAERVRPARKKELSQGRRRNGPRDAARALPAGKLTPVMARCLPAQSGLRPRNLRASELFTF